MMAFGLGDWLGEASHQSSSLLYHDMPPAEALNIVKRLRKQYVRTFWRLEGAYSEFLDVPFWYLYSTEDHALEHWIQ